MQIYRDSSPETALSTMRFFPFTLCRVRMTGSRRGSE